VPIDPQSELELSPELMREMLELANEKVLEHIRGISEQPAAGSSDGAALAASLIEGMPETGTPFSELLELIFDRLAPESFSTVGPGFMAYIPGGGIFHAAVADLVADVTNRYITVWAAAPGLVQLEINVIRWFCDMVGYPAGSGGFLATGGSLANFSGLVTARRERLPENFLSGTLYASDQVHHSVVKSATLAGFPERNVRRVPSDGRFRIRLDALAEAIRNDRRAGLDPFLVVGSAGTTNTGAVDDLTALADLAEAERLWLHLDAAYGGFFLLTERGRRVMRGIERADSITLDPHKGMFLPYGTGCLLTRDVEALRRAHGLRGEYMLPAPETAEQVDFCDLSPELSRDFRGLRVWLPLKMHGVGAFERALDEKLDLTAVAARELAQVPGIRLLDEPQLTVVAFRYEPPDVEEPELERLNRDLLDRINERKRVLISGTVIDGRFVLRFCILQFRTHQDHLDQGLEDLRDAVETLSPATVASTSGVANPS
jgi:aromatic-L-amino-acid decarboxylase